MCNRCSGCKGAGLAAFILGALVGAAAGVLMAPAKGETTRRRLKKLAGDAYEDQKEFILEHAEDLKEKVKEHAGDVREKLSEKAEAVREKLAEGRDKVAKEISKRKEEIAAKFKKEEE